MLFSIRTRREADDAGEMAERHSMGWEMRAAIRTAPAADSGPKMTEALQDQLRKRWLETCGAEGRRGTRLVAPREIKENLERHGAIS